MQPTDAECQQVIDEVIQKLMVVLGPDITFTKIRHHKGIVVNKAGKVIGYKENPSEVLQSLTYSFLELSPFVVGRVIEGIVKQHPNITVQLHLEGQKVV